MQNTKLIEVGDYNGDAVYINTSNITQVMNNEEIVELVKKTYPDLNILAITLIGSRTFGEPRNDSDYDIRFVYSRPVNDYITIDKVPEQTKQVVDHKIDLIGYDAQYFFRQLSNNNVLAVEFLRALMYNPILTCYSLNKCTYSEVEDFLDKEFIIKKYTSFIASEIKREKRNRIETLYSHIKDIESKCNSSIKNKFIVHDTFYMDDETMLLECNNSADRALRGNKEILKTRCKIILENIMINQK